MASAEAGGTFFFHHYVHGGTYPLARDLHETKFAKRQYVVTRAVLLHDLHHVLVELVTMLSLGHIDEVNNYDAAYITQPELTCNFIGSADVYVEGTQFLRLRVFRAVAAVYVYHVEGFGMFNNKVCPALECNSFTEGGLYLLCYSKFVENRNIALIEFDNVFLFRGNDFEVVLNFFVGAGVVYVDGLVGWVE